MRFRLFIPDALHLRSVYVLPAILIGLATLAFLRVWLVQDLIWDDNFWAEAIYECQSYECFYKAGFLEMARPQLAPFTYALYWLFRNSDYFYVAWHGINTITALGSPLLLYLFLRNLFPKKQPLAFFSAAAFILFHLDQTLGYASAANYRIGLILSIFSFYLVERAFQKEEVRPKYLAGAAVCAILSHSVFIEAALALEPARGLVILYLVRTRLSHANPHWLSALRHWYLFALLTLPIITYKLLYKPHGAYGHMYDINPLFFLEWRNTLVALAHYLQFSWVITLHHLDEIATTSWVIAISAFVGFYFLLYKTEGLPVLGKLRTELKTHPANHILRSAWRTDREFLLLGAVAFLLPTLFFQIVSRPPISFLETYSSHAAISQMGYAMLAGWLLSVLYKASILRNKCDPWLKYVVAAIFAVGVFFNNATTDHYLKSWENQNRLWTAFTQRFPSVPDGKHFVFDTSAPNVYPDITNVYSLEFHLNLLYATSANPVPFRRVTANSADAWSDFAAVTLFKAMQKKQSSEGKNVIKLPELLHLPMERGTYFGPETIAPEDIVFVYYRNGVLLVNDEISKKFPDIAYKDWLSKPFPELPPAPSSYPLRYKMRGPGADF